MSIKLYPHQVEDLEYMRDRKAVALYHEVGAGKSFPCIVRTLEILHAIGGTVVVFTEVSLLHQLREDYYKVIGNRDEVRIEVLSGKTKAHDKRRIMSHPPDVVIINYEYAQRIEDWLMQLKVACVWCDEGHRLKGYRGARSKYGKRAKVIMRLAKTSPYRILTTGSPIVNPNSPDIWALYAFLDERIFGPTLWKFEQEFFYNVVQGQPFKKLMLKPHMQEEISKRMYQNARRLTKAELARDYGVKFPDRMDPIRYDASMSNKLKKAYRELEMMSLTMAEGEVITRPLLLGRLMALQQLASGFLIEKDALDPMGLLRDEKTRRVLHVDSSHKDNILVDILERIGDESCIIWAVFTHEIDHIMKLVTKVRGEVPSRGDGKCTGEARKAGVEAFQSRKVKTLVAHPAAMGAGLNLQIAGHAIRYSRTYKLIEWEQSRGRNHRAGTLIHEQIFDHELVTPETSDEKIFVAVNGKVDLASTITLDHLDHKERNK